MCVSRAKKNADIAKAVADDLIMQAMEEDVDEDAEPEKDADDIIDVAAAIAGPIVEDVSHLRIAPSSLTFRSSVPAYSRPVLQLIRHLQIPEQVTLRSQTLELLKVWSL